MPAPVIEIRDPHHVRDRVPALVPGAVEGAVVVGFTQDGAADAEGELGDAHSCG